MEKERSHRPANPPPLPKVQAGGEPIVSPTENDVLSGRGGRVNSHPGNRRYRALVNSVKSEYLSPNTRKREKACIAARLVWAIRGSDPPGRFLKEDAGTGMWREIGDRAAFRKTGQALRENSSEYRSYWSEEIARGRPGGAPATAEGGPDGGFARGGETYGGVPQDIPPVSEATHTTPGQPSFNEYPTGAYGVF